MLGEKYLNPDHYATGDCGADNETLYVGYDNDNYRTTYYDTLTGLDPNQLPQRRPRRDQRGVESLCDFGSAHPAGWHAAFCDGSVRRMSFSIDLETHRRLGNREDRLKIDPTKF